MPNDNRVLSSLNYLAKNRIASTFIQGTISGDDKEINKFGIKVRDSTPCAIVIAGIDAEDPNSKNVSEKIGLVSEKIKNGMLVLLRFGPLSQGELTTYTRSTVIVTGEGYFPYASHLPKM